MALLGLLGYPSLVSDSKVSMLSLLFKKSISQQCLDSTHILHIKYTHAWYNAIIHTVECQAYKNARHRDHDGLNFEVILIQNWTRCVTFGRSTTGLLTLRWSASQEQAGWGGVREVTRIQMGKVKKK